MQELMNKEKPGIVCIQETKQVNIPNLKYYSVWGNNEISWVHRGVDKEGGDILTMWSKQLFICSRIVEGKGFIMTEREYKHEDNNQFVEVALINVYSPCLATETYTLWEEITTIIDNNRNLGWCVMGDFNAVRNINERKGVGNGHVNRNEIEKFNRFIDTCMLMDIPAVGRRFTWYRPYGTTRSRIDRVLVSGTWLVYWPGVTQHIKDRIVSDHCALVVQNKVIDWGPKPFRTFDVWQNTEGFKGVVKNSCIEIIVWSW